MFKPRHKDDRAGLARHGLVTAVIVLAMGSGAVVAEQGDAGVDATVVQQTVALLDDWLACPAP